MSREEFGHHYNHSRKERTQEKSLEGNRYSRRIKLRHKPEDQSTGHRAKNVCLGTSGGIMYAMQCVLTEIAIFSPTRGVTNPSTMRPTVIPSQNPVAVIPLAKALPSRTRIMKVTIQPPSATSTPTYPNKKMAHSHVTRAEGRLNSARFNPPCRFSSADCTFAARNSAALAFQKHAPHTNSSTTAHAT